MAIIYKYAMSKTRETFKIPMHGEILKVASQNDIPTIWILVNSEVKEVMDEREFAIIGTGEEFKFDPAMEYLDSVLILNDAIVWHVFEIHKDVI